jgi:hypothetical protein
VNIEYRTPNAEYPSEVVGQAATLQIRVLCVHPSALLRGLGGLTGEVQHVCRQSCRVIRLFGFAWSLLLGTLSPDLWDFSL